MQTNFSEITALFKHFKPLNEECLEKAKARDASLTKPPGSLGKLEQLAFWYASVRGEARANLNHPRIALFAGNHGIAKITPFQLFQQMLPRQWSKIFKIMARQSIKLPKLLMLIFISMKCS